MLKYKIVLFISKLKIGVFQIPKDEIHLIDSAKTYNKTFKDIIKSSDYNQFKKELLKNLDFKSKIITKRLLRRISQYVLKNKKIFKRTLFEEINLKIANYYKKITVKEAENGWKYENFLISRKHFNNQIFWDKYFINEFKYLDKIKNLDIIDVGAFIGDSAVLFEKYTNKNVRAFEPVKESYNDLLKTIKINNSNKIIPYKLGLGSKKEELTINVFDNSGVGATLRQDRKDNCKKTETINIDKLDDVIKNENIKVGLIKIDTEGAEQAFLDGALQTIKTQKPALLFAIYHTGEDFFQIKSRIEKLNLGYKFKIRKATKNGILDDTILICEVR